MKTEGGGDRDAIWPAQREVSPSTTVVSFAWGAAAAAGGVRREMVSRRETLGWESRVVRMWEPYAVVSDGAIAS